VVKRVAGRPQGIKGETTVEVRTDDPEDRFAIGRVLLTDEGPLTVANSRYQGKFLVVQFEGVHDRNAAELLRDRLLQLPIADLPPLAEDDEYYDTQLIGLTAQLGDGTVLGVVSDVLHLPHGDVLSITREDAPELLVPFVKAIVPVVDLDAGHLVVDPPEGLLDLAAAPVVPEV
jgi:16S rRNA processing protein RimM